MCLIVAPGPRSPISLVGRCRSCFPALSPRLTYQSWQAAGSCGHDRNALGGAAGYPDCRRFRAGLRREQLVGIGAPKATPAEIIEKLNTEINAGLADPKMKARLADLGGTPLAGSPADFGKLIAEETEKWGKVIRAANIKPE